MPEFILDHGSSDAAREFRKLDSFTQGYIEALFFTECEHGTVRDSDGDTRMIAWNPEQHSSLPGDATVAELAPETWAQITADCAEFQQQHVKLLEQAYARDGYDAEAAGRDYWYTRNGHGVGFWDRDALKGELGEHLTQVSRLHGSADIYLGDDGLIYQS